MSLIREDDKGIYVLAGGYKGRPGPVIGWDHAYDTSDGGLKKGNHVKANHMAGTEMIRIITEEGKELAWKAETRLLDGLTLIPF